MTHRTCAVLRSAVLLPDSMGTFECAINAPLGIRNPLLTRLSWSQLPFASRTIARFRCSGVTASGVIVYCADRLHSIAAIQSCLPTLLLRLQQRHTARAIQTIDDVSKDALRSGYCCTARDFTLGTAAGERWWRRQVAASKTWT